MTRSGLLVILATPKACESSAVEDEIREFLKTGRTIVPVRLCRDITKARWWPLIQGLAISSEPLLAVDQNGSGEAPVPEAPSEATISRIVNSISFQTRNQRLRRDASAALAVLLLSIIGAVFEARVAKTNAAKADQEQKMEHRAGLLYKARTALNNQDPRLAARLSLEARQVADGGDARLVFAEAYNSAIPFELPPLFRDIRLFHLDPSNPDRLLVIGNQGGTPPYHNQLALIDVHTQNLISASNYRFLAAAFAPEGGKIYAVAITKFEHGPNEGMDTKMLSEVSLLEYNLSLQLQKSMRIDTISPTAKFRPQHRMGCARYSGPALYGLPRSHRHGGLRFTAIYEKRVERDATSFAFLGDACQRGSPS